MTFSRQATTPERQLRNIADAYTVAGIEPPKRTTDVLDAIAALPSVSDVSNDLARQSFDTHDTDGFLQAAIARVAEAQAADTLRSAIAVHRPAATRQRMPGILTQAAKDLAPAFGRTVKTITAAAGKLDQEKPLSVDFAVRDDTTKQLKQAQASLAELSIYASIFLRRSALDVPGHLLNVLPIVDLPACVVEVVVASLSETKRAVNPEECAGTYVVRKLARALEQDTDAALIAVARGDYEGVTLTLADPTALKLRTAYAARSNRRREAAPGQRARTPAAAN